MLEYGIQVNEKCNLDVAGESQEFLVQFFILFFLCTGTEFRSTVQYE